MTCWYVFPLLLLVMAPQLLHSRRPTHSTCEQYCSSLSLSGFHFSLCVQINVATSLVAGGETGIFTPMHLLVFQKPEANGEGH